MSTSFRDRLPPGLISIVATYGAFLGFLALIQYFDVVDFFLPRQFASTLMVVGTIFGSISVVKCFHPEWHDWSRDNQFGGD